MQMTRSADEPLAFAHHYGLRLKTDDNGGQTRHESPAASVEELLSGGPVIRLLLVDDEVAVRRGLRMQLELEPDVEVVGEASDGSGALDLIERLRPDVVLMDVRMKGMDGLQTLEALNARGPRTAVVMLTLHDDAITRAHAFAAGARAFVGKHEPSEALVDAIRNAFNPPPFRSSRTA